jgi:SET domain-containing protein
VAVYDSGEWPRPLANRRIVDYFQRVPRSPYRVSRSSAGLGLFATKPIRKRAYIVTYRGRLLRTEAADELERRGSKYMFEINSRWTIDGSSRSNLARYVNHSCRPNAEAVQRKLKIVYVARRNIKPEEEITVDYGKDYFDAFIKKHGCRCAACHTKAYVKRSKRRQGKRKRAKR